MIAWAWLACAGTKDGTTSPPPDDADADTDVDTDTDVGHTGGPGRHTGAAPDLWDADEVLVVPDGDGLTLLGPDGGIVFRATWSELVGPCDLCGGEGSSDDGDGLLLSFTTEGPASGGAVARLGPSGALDWRVDGFGFPHDAERDPADGTVLVPQVQGSIVTWIAGDGSSPDPVRTLDRETAGWEGLLPNGAERFDHDGRRYLLLSHRGVSLPGQPGGFLSFWDITDPTAITWVWRFPAFGSLRAPHGAVIRRFDGHQWLVYAHSDGLDEGSAVGLAWLDDPTAPPRYVADLRPVGPSAPFDFLRGVEVTTDGRAWLTDSGPGGGTSVERSGRVLRAELPLGLAPTGRSGQLGDQEVVDFRPAPFATDLRNPFEGWLWRNTFP